MLKAAFLASCACVLIDASDSGTAATSVPAALVGHWLAEDIGGNGVIDDLQTTLEINDDGTYAGFAGCNSYTGIFSIKDARIVFEPASTTRKICAPAILDQETKFLAALGAPLAWTVAGTKLVFTRIGDEIANLRLAPHVETAQALVKISPTDRQKVRYDCGGVSVDAEYITAGELRFVNLSLHGQTVMAVNVPSGSGVKYAGADYAWLTDGEGAKLLDLTKGESDPGTVCTVVP